MKPLFSIITITYNSGHYLEEAVNSVLSQDYADFEYLLIDGGSTDGTLDLIKRYAGLDPRILWVSEPDKGIADAMNKGLRMASGDIVAHLHSDDTYLPGALYKVANAFTLNPEAKWLTGCLRYVDGAGELLYETELKSDYSLKSLLQQNIIGHPATFIRQELFAELGGFDQSRRYAMDYDLWLRIAPRYPLLPLPEVLATFRSHEQSLSSRENLRTLAEDYRIRQHYRARYNQGGAFGDVIRYFKKALLISLGLHNLRKRLMARFMAKR